MTINHYIIDSCSLINLIKHTPMDIFPSVWKNINYLIHKNYLHSPFEVYNELTKKDDMIGNWAKNNYKIFIHESEEQILMAKEIIKKFPALLDLTKSFCADPWIIALAYNESYRNTQKTILEEKVIVVTEEHSRGNKVNIPFVCKIYNIECIDLNEMHRCEGWQY